MATARRRGHEHRGVVAVMGTDGNIAVYSPQDLRTRVLTSLGFEVPAELASLPAVKPGSRGLK